MTFSLQLIQGLDLILPLMYVGEIAEVKISPRFAYGTRGDEDLKIPPEAILNYTIEVLSVASEEEFDSMSVETRKEIGYGNELIFPNL